MYHIFASTYLDLASSPSSPKEEFFIWLVFTVILPLLPIVLTLVGIVLINSFRTVIDNYIGLFKDGELFFFAAALSAISIKQVLRLPPQPASTVNIPTWVSISFLLAAFILTLALSIFIFALCIYSKLRKKQDELSSVFIIFISLFCSATAGILSYFVYAYGGT